MNALTRGLELALLALVTSAAEGGNGDLTSWTRVFEQAGHDGVFGALPIDDGHAIAVGATGYRHFPPYSGDALIMFVDLADGSVMSERTWGGAGFDQAWQVARAPDNGYYVFGETDSYGAGDRDFFLLKLDSRGEDEWYRTYGTAKREWPFGMLQLHDGDLLLYGRTENDAGVEDAYVVRVDPTGSEVWEHLNRTSEPVLVLDAIETSAGDIVLSTSVGEDPGLTFLNANGLVLAKRRFELPGWQYASGIERTEGGYLMAGFFLDREAGGKADVWLAKVSLDGEMLWQRSFGDEATDDYATTLLRLSDRSYVIGGMGPGLPVWRLDISGQVTSHRILANGAVYAAFGLTELPGHGLLVSGVKAIVSARSYHGVMIRTDGSFGS
jgi:hypothetical protein